MAPTRLLTSALLLASTALARTDLIGCTSSDAVVSADPPYATVIWYVPDTGELCDFLDCGGGMAPPKTTVPGCPLYSGTATYSPSYLNLKTMDGGSGGASVTIVETTSSTSSEARLPTLPHITGGTTYSGPPKAGHTEITRTIPGKESSEGVTASSGVASTQTVSPGTTTAASQGSVTAATTAPSSVPTGAAAAPTVAALWGSCLVAGVAAWAGVV